MSLPNHPDAQLDVLTTVTHVLDVFEDMIESEITNCAAVYDEQLTFESGIKSYIEKNNFEAAAKTDYPVFLYNRSPMRWPRAAPSRRLNNFKGTLRTDEGISSYRATHGEFDIPFMYVSRSVESQEKFEIAYHSDSGISGNRMIELDIPEVGKFQYFLSYSELTGKSINYDEAAYTAIIGQLTVRGFYFTFEAKANVIKHINLKIFGRAVPGPAGDLSGLLGSVSI